MAQPITPLTCFLILAGLSLFSFGSFGDSQSADDVPMPKLSQNVGVPTLKVLYWWVLLIRGGAWHFYFYTKNYVPATRAVIRRCLNSMSRSSNKSIRTSLLMAATTIRRVLVWDWPSSLWVLFDLSLGRDLVNSIKIWQGIAKMIIIICIIGGVNVFEYINQPRPSWWTWCLDNKLYACMMLFFLCNLLEGQLIQSGAFEMTLNDVPVWSKLETGRVPQPNELFDIIDNHMRFADSKIEYDNFAK